MADPGTGEPAGSPGTRQHPGLRVVLYTLVALLLAGGFVWSGLVEAGSAWRAGLDQGIRGTLIATSHDCDRSCTTMGDFTSADRRTVRRHVEYLGDVPRDAHVGDAFSALDTGGSAVYAPGDWLPFILDLLVIIVGIGVVVGWVRSYLIPRLRRPPPSEGEWLSAYLAPPDLSRRSRHSRRGVLAGFAFALLPLLTCGFATAVVFVFAALFLPARGRRAVVLWVSAGFYVLAAVLVVVNFAADADTAAGTVALVAWIVLAVVGSLQAIVFAPWVARQADGPAPAEDGRIVEEAAADERSALSYDPELRLVIQQRERRRLSRGILANDPELARSLAIGRPDLERRFVDGGLIDVNHVPAWVLADLPGFNAEMADRVVRARERLDGLRSVADLVVYADVPADVVAMLTDTLVFRADPDAASPG